MTTVTPMFCSHCAHEEPMPDPGSPTLDACPKCRRRSWQNWSPKIGLGPAEFPATIKCNWPRDGQPRTAVWTPT